MKVLNINHIDSRDSALILPHIRRLDVLAHFPMTGGAEKSFKLHTSQGWQVNRIERYTNNAEIESKKNKQYNYVEL